MNHQDTKTQSESTVNITTKAQRRAVESRPVQLNMCMDTVVLLVYLILVS